MKIRKLFENKLDPIVSQIGGRSDTLLVSRSEYPKDKPFLLKEFLVRNFVIGLQGHVTYYNLP